MSPRFRLRGKTPNSDNQAVISGIRYVKASNYPYSFNQMYNGRVQRFEVRSGDLNFPPDAITGNERSEIVSANILTAGLAYPFNTDVWLSFAFQVEPGAPITSSFGVVGQFHDYPDPADTVPLSPVMCFAIGQGVDTVQYEVHTRFDVNAASTSNPSPTARFSATLTRGTWIRIVARIQFHWTTGQLQLWADGVEICNLFNIGIGYSSPKGPYWQFGLYRAADPNTTVVRYANVEQGLPSLIDRVANPLSIPT